MGMGLSLHLHLQGSPKCLNSCQGSPLGSLKARFLDRQADNVELHLNVSIDVAYADPPVRVCPCGFRILTALCIRGFFPFEGEANASRDEQEDPFDVGQQSK